MKDRTLFYLCLFGMLCVLVGTWEFDEPEHETCFLEKEPIDEGGFYYVLYCDDIQILVESYRKGGR